MATIYIKEENLIPKYHKNKKYLNEESKKKATAKNKHEKYTDNKEYIKLMTSKRYYTKKLQKMPNDEATKEKIAEIEEQLKTFF